MFHYDSWLFVHMFLHSSINDSSVLPTLHPSESTSKPWALVLAQTELRAPRTEFNHEKKTYVACRLIKPNICRFEGEKTHPSHHHSKANSTKNPKPELYEHFWDGIPLLGYQFGVTKPAVWNRHNLPRIMAHHHLRNTLLGRTPSCQVIRPPKKQQQMDKLLQRTGANCTQRCSGD